MMAEHDADILLDGHDYILRILRELFRYARTS
jgi:hypothetical protein